MFSSCTLCSITLSPWQPESQDVKSSRGGRGLELRPSVFLSLSLSLSVSHYLGHTRTHTHTHAHAHAHANKRLTSDVIPLLISAAHSKCRFQVETSQRCSAASLRRRTQDHQQQTSQTTTTHTHQQRHKHHTTSSGCSSFNIRVHRMLKETNKRTNRKSSRVKI